MFTLPLEQWKAIGRGAAVAAAGAALTYLAQAIGQNDFGQATPLVVAAFSVVANYLRKTLLEPAE